MNGDGDEGSVGSRSGANGARNVAWSQRAERDQEANNNGGDYVKLEDRPTSSTKKVYTRSRSALDIVSTTPWLVWPVFVVSIVVGASSAAVLVSMKRAAPISLAGWRHQVSSVILLPAFIYQWTRLPKGDRQKAFFPRNLGLHLICAVALSGHFATYTWSLAHTSMTHCLFLTCMSPIFVVIYTKVAGGVLLTGELIGVSLGLVGVATLAAGTRVERDNISTHVGDLVALGAAASMAIYLIVGKNLRSWMPLFVYQFPIAVASSIMLAVGGLLLEGWNESDSGDISGPFSWIRREYLLGTFFLAAGPGVIGHAGYSFVLRYASPLVMPTGLSLQPIIGSTLGWAVGESPTPGLWTCIGGAVTLGGTLWVTCASAQREAIKRKAIADALALQQPAADEEGQQETKPLLDQ